MLRVPLEYWQGTGVVRSGSFRVSLRTQVERDFADALVKAYGFKDHSELTRYLIRKEAEAKTLVKTEIVKIKNGTR